MEIHNEEPYLHKYDPYGQTDQLTNTRTNERTIYLVDCLTKNVSFTTIINPSPQNVHRFKSLGTI